MDNKILGIIGGGQLGRMIALAASHLGVKSHIYDPNPDSPAFDVASKIFNHKFDDSIAIEKFAKSVDATVYEFENIPISTAKKIELICPLRPSSEVLSISQDRLIEKCFLRDKAKVSPVDFRKCDSIKDLLRAVKEFDYSAIVKTRRLGYDGKGQLRINKNTNLQEVFKILGSSDLILERFMPFKRELSIIVARSQNGNIEIYDCVENKHKNHILDETIAPAPNLDRELAKLSQSIAKKIATALNLVGILAVEMFEMENGKLIVNEIAPRPHNSGHWTMDGCITSQFEQSVRAALDWPLGKPERNFDIVMKNLIGSDISLVKSFIGNSNYKTYIYGKKDIRKGRKMGHINRIIEKNANITKFLNE